MNNRIFWKFTLRMLVLQVLAVGYLQLHAQESANPIGQVSISSPTAAALGKYGDIPVNYHTGIPQTDVPIYTVRSGSLGLPIGLSYHAGGIKTSELASWVGAGWSLNAGGVITRTVRGVADDKGYQGFQGFGNKATNGHYSDYGFNSYLMVTTVDGQLPDGKGTDDHIFATGYKDGEPDLFFFNFGAYSGKFYFNDDRTPVIVPEQDIKIETDYLLGPGFNGFTLTTPDGEKYYFGRTGNHSSTVDPVEMTVPSTIVSGPANGDAAASSWYLNKIVNAESTDSITFQYQAETYSYYTWSMFPIANYTTSETTPNQLNGTDLVKNYVNGVRLSQINFANGQIIFAPSSSPRADLSAGYAASPGMNDLDNTSSYSLGSISISDNHGFCKKFSLSYGYFSDNTTNLTNTFWSSSLNVYNLHTDKTSLRLDQIQEASCDASVQVPPYTFSYFSDMFPRRLSFGIDHWGFYNGVTGNNNLIPTHTVKFQGLLTQMNGANRESAWPAMRGGALQTMTYPTGGSTTFEFEPNTTFCNFTQYTKANAGGGAVGFGGTTDSRTPFTSSGNSGTIYYFDIVSTTSVGAGLEILDQNQNVVQNLVSSPNTTVSYSVQLMPNTNYTLWLHKEDGSGTVQANLTIWSPTTVSANTIVGGLRIKTITSTDPISSQSIATSFGYNVGNNTGGNSSGILYSKPTYVKLVKNAVYDQVFPYPSSGCDALLCGQQSGGLCANASEQYYKSPTSVRPMATTQGSHIGYNEVYVTQSGNGSSVYRYYGSNIWDLNINDVCTRMVDWDNICDANIPNTPEPPIPFEFMRGVLKYEGYFNESGHLLKDVWHFPVFQPSLLITPAYIITVANGAEINAVYNSQSARKVSDSTQTTLYDPIAATSLSTKQVTYYGSQYHHQPTETVSYTSTGDSLITRTSYAQDFRITACDGIDNGISIWTLASHADSISYQNQLLTCTPQGPTIGADVNCRHINYQRFMENMSNDRVAFIQTRLSNISGPSNLFDTHHLLAEDEADGSLKPILRLQDLSKIVPIEVSEWKNQNLRHSAFTHYDISLTPSAIPYPSLIQTLNLQAVSNSFTPAISQEAYVQKDSRYADESKFLFVNGNPLQSTGHDGIPNSYVWDYSNKEPIAKVTNATVDQVAYTSFESDGGGNWTIASSLRDAGGITGGQSYNLGNGSCSKSGLTSANTYVVSYWSKTGVSYTVTGSASSIQGKTINGWTYFEHKVIGVSAVSITGTGDVDELRLYPASAQMTTYTYSPVFGMTSQCDVDNRVAYYFYDALGRLQYIKDQDGNILKTIDYHYSIQ
jgi:hypothetical protein